MMVNSEIKSILGIAGQAIHHRPKTKRRKNESRSQQLNRQRESQVWGIVIDQIGPPQNDAQYVDVCDRGADNFEVFCHLLMQKSDWVNRAKSKSRYVQATAGKTVALKEFLKELSIQGTYELELRSRPQQPTRTAKIEIQTGSLLMPLPRHTSAWVKSLNPDPIAMNVVWVREVDVPAGVPPIEWILYTSLPVETFEQIWEVIEMYETRWLIEEYHKALKTGCRVKDRQLKTGARLEAMVGLMSVVAVHLLSLKSLANSEPERLARTVVPLLWLQMLKSVRKNLHRIHDITVSEFYREVAK